MKKVLLIFSIIFLLQLTSKSQDAAELLVKKIYSNEHINSMVNNYQSYFKQIALKTYKSDADTNYIKFMNFVLEEARQMIKKMAESDLVSIYKNIFSTQELKELYDFYNSPIGKKYMEKSPEISKSMQNLVLEKYFPDLQQKVENYLKKKEN